MATPRALDPDKLKELLEADPTLAQPDRRRELAGRLTLWNREHGSDVTVTPRLVTAAISRHRERWAGEGLDLSAHLQRRYELIRMLVENSGHHIADIYQETMIPKQLRRVERLRKGQPVAPNRVDAARAFEAKLFDQRRVVDVTPGGKPYIRAARTHELDGDGKLIEIVCASPERRQGSGRGDVHPS